METQPFTPNPAEQLPPPTGAPLAPELLGNLQIDPTLATEQNDRFVHNDAGMIDMAPIAEKVDDLRVSYHGLKFSIARVREERARERIDKLNYKDVAYNDMSSTADARHHPLTQGQLESLPATQRADRLNRLSDPDATMRPSTKAEKRMDKRQDRRQFKARQKRAIAASSGLGRRQLLLQHTKESPTERLKARINNATSDNSAHDKEIEKLRIKSTTSNRPDRFSRKANRGLRKANRVFNRTKSQPIASRWRALRRKTSQMSANRHERRAQKHLDKAIDINNN